MGVPRTKARFHEFESLAGIGSVLFLGGVRRRIFRSHCTFGSVIVSDGNLARHSAAASEPARSESPCAHLWHDGMDFRAGVADKLANLPSVNSL